MPRVNRKVIKEYKATRFLPAFRISANERKELSKFFHKLDSELVDGLLEEIEFQILARLNFAGHAHGSPNSAHYVTAFESIEKRAKALRVVLEGTSRDMFDDPRIAKLGLWRSEQLLKKLREDAARGTSNFNPPPTLLEQIKELESCSHAVVCEHRNRKSQGAPKQNETLFAVWRLLEVYRDYFGSAHDGIHMGENARTKFVYLSLRAAKAISEKHNWQAYTESLIKQARKENR